MRGLGRLVAVTALVWAALAGAAHAATEIGDAGELPATAQDLGAEAALDAIAGSLDGVNDRDVYRVCLEGGGGFSASTVGATEVDTQLFLLDAEGRGVYANDDAPGVLGQSTLPAEDPLTPTAAGPYHLAIARWNQDPRDASGAALFADVVTTVGPLGAGPIAFWTAGREGTFGAYAIALTGVVPCAVPDDTPPTIDLRTPADGDAFAVGEAVEADYECADEDGGSGLASCVGDVPDGAPIDTSAPGARTFTVTATDGAGNTSVETVAYEVEPAFAFGGFLGPLVDPPGVAQVEAGAVVAVRFRLGGDHGDDVLAHGYPRSAEVSCETFADADPDAAEPTDAAWSWWWRWRGDRLRYDRHDDAYVYLWQTKRRWAGDCRQLILKLSDGSVQRANVELERKRWHWGWGWKRARAWDRGRAWARAAHRHHGKRHAHGHRR